MSPVVPQYQFRKHGLRHVRPQVASYNKPQFHRVATRGGRRQIFADVFPRPPAAPGDATRMAEPPVLGGRGRGLGPGRCERGRSPHGRGGSVGRVGDRSRRTARPHNDGAHGRTGTRARGRHRRGDRRDRRPPPRPHDRRRHRGDRARGAVEHGRARAGVRPRVGLRRRDPVPAQAARGPRSLRRAGRVAAPRGRCGARPGAAGRQGLGRRRGADGRGGRSRRRVCPRVAPPRAASR